MLAVTTQIAEMSLDISADLLITEYAPVYALIQRLGRLNRYEDCPSEVKNAFFLKPENALPYGRSTEEEKLLWDQTGFWLDDLSDGAPKSQQEIGYSFMKLQTRTEEFDPDLFL